MVVAVVAMMISAISGKSYIDLHKAQKFENSVPKYSHSHISKSQLYIFS